MNPSEFDQDEPQPSTSASTSTSTNGIRASARAFSTNDRLGAASRASMTSAMSTQSNIDYGSNASEIETLDPFIRYLNSRFQGISNTRKRRRLEDLFLNEIKKIEDGESDQKN